MKRNQELPEVIEGEHIPARPHVLKPATIRLNTIRDCRRELAKVYCDARQGRIEAAEGTKLAFMLTGLSKMIEVDILEQRIQKLERKSNGYA